MINVVRHCTDGHGVELETPRWDDRERHTTANREGPSEMKLATAADSGEKTLVPAALNSRMNDRSDEVTERRDTRSTDDLLSETERLLSDADGGSGPETSSRDRQDAVGSGETPGFESGSESTAEPATGETSDQSRLSGLTGRLSVEEYFSPKAFLALLLTIGAGLFAGGAVLPVAGQLIGIFVTAFLIGLVTSRRRYLELTAAGVPAGAVTTLDPVYVALGSGWTLLGIGAAIGFAASVGGYYFGRDLRDGLVRDIP